MMMNSYLTSLLRRTAILSIIMLMLMLSVVIDLTLDGVAAKEVRHKEIHRVMIRLYTG